MAREDRIGDGIGGVTEGGEEVWTREMDIHRDVLEDEAFR